MIFKKKKCHTETLAGVKKEAVIFVMRGKKSLAMFTALNGRVHANYDLDPPLFTDIDSYLIKYSEAWRYICNVASIQRNNAGAISETFDIDIDDFF